jgi:hypothetical protein
MATGLSSSLYRNRSLEIRPARPSELAAVRDLMARRAVVGGDADGCVVMVALVDGKIVAAATADCGRLPRAAVACERAWVGHGIGARLGRAVAEEICRLRLDAQTA